MRPWLLSFDLTSVVVFVAAGRSTHNEGNSFGHFLHTAAPFLIALGLGWLLARAWKDATSTRTGAIVLIVTFAVGMLLRKTVYGDGTAASFMLVAAAFLTLFLIGWRIVARRWV